MPYKRRSKYGAIATTVDGIRFHSAKEAGRYVELKMLGLAGQLTDLEFQPSFVLRVRVFDAPVSMIVGKYVGDFRYFDTTTSRYVVEDVKGFRTPLYRWKKKHVELQYGITIREI